MTQTAKKIKEFYGDLVFRRTYAKVQGETWEQAINRYYLHYKPLAKKLGLFVEFKEAIALYKKKELVGSMRGLATAGKALELYPEAVYNCSYINFTSWEAFADMFILLMLGVGVGYSVEKHTIKLPKRPMAFRQSSIIIAPEDSKEGWRDSFYSLLVLLQGGLIPKFDYHLIRPAGAPLKTFKGTASGYLPLKFLFEKTIKLFTSKPNQEWTPEELFDLANLIANAVISGGVRRSACIALVDKEDVYKLKPEGFWNTHPWRAYSNISITSLDKADIEFLVSYWKEQRTGEPGIFNRKRAQEKLREVGRKEDIDDTLGTNPCGEVLLKPFSFCNLTEVNVKTNDSLKFLIKKVKAAALLGILQGYNTKFTALINPLWQKNAEEEPLLGVSLTGLRTHYILSNVSKEATQWLKVLKREVKKYVKLIGDKINKEYTAVTTVKPSGTVSQVLGTTSGLHSAYSRYVIRRLRLNKNDSLLEELKQYPLNIEQDIYNPDTVVLSFPLFYPNYKYRDTLDQLSYYLQMFNNWTDHNPSTTITIDDKSWDTVRHWLKKNYNNLIGITFLPEYHTLQQAPYEAIDEMEFAKLVDKWKSAFKKHLDFKITIDPSKSFSSKTYACSAGGSCEIDTL